MPVHRQSAQVYTALILLFGFQADAADQPNETWLTDAQARAVVASTLHARYSEPCYTTDHNDRLEASLTSLRSNSSVFIYRAASDTCSYVTFQDGKTVRMIQTTLDCCEYGLIAVDRATAKSYWFTQDAAPSVFENFITDEQLRPDLPEARLFFALYHELVWGDPDETQMNSLEQLQNAVQQNFQSAYSPYERDKLWQSKFDHWWRRFLSKNAKLTLATTYKPANGGVEIHGYGFNGFQLTIPRSDPPPKGTPQLFQWTFLIKSNGTVEQLPSKVIYANR